VQDYHFALVPRFLRARCPNAIIVAFWHIPWPAVDQLVLCPYHRELVQGLLGSDIVGFQTPAHCQNFLETVDEAHGVTLDRPRQTILHRGGTVHVRCYPISVEWPVRGSLQVPAVAECRRAVFAEHGLDPACSLVVSVDRLDYTKGFEQRLAAIERMLEMASSGRRVAFLQIAAPSRAAISRYAELAARVRSEVARINRRFGDERFVPLTLVERHTEPADVFRCYRAADVCYVSSLDDGMNLVAKEFVAARDDEQGVLVLSRFAGAARELTDALIVNPYDVDGVADALGQAVTLTSRAQQTRMRALRRRVAEHNVYSWAGEMLADAACVRRQEAPAAAVERSWSSASARIM